MFLLEFQHRISYIDDTGFRLKKDFKAALALTANRIIPITISATMTDIQKWMDDLEQRYNRAVSIHREFTRPLSDIDDARKLGFFWHWLVGCFLTIPFMLVLCENMDSLLSNWKGALIFIPFAALFLSIFSYLIMNLFPKPYATLQRKLNELVSVSDLMY